MDLQVKVEATLNLVCEVKDGVFKEEYSNRYLYTDSPLDGRDVLNKLSKELPDGDYLIEIKVTKK